MSCLDIGVNFNSTSSTYQFTNYLQLFIHFILHSFPLIYFCLVVHLGMHIINHPCLITIISGNFDVMLRSKIFSFIIFEDNSLVSNQVMKLMHQTCKKKCMKHANTLLINYSINDTSVSALTFRWIINLFINFFLCRGVLWRYMAQRLQEKLHWPFM